MLVKHGKAWVSYADKIEKVSDSYSITTEDSNVYIYFPVDMIKEYEKWYDYKHRLYMGLQYTTPKYKDEKYKDYFCGHDPILIETIENKKYYVFELSHYSIVDRVDTRFVLLGIDY